MVAIRNSSLFILSAAFLSSYVNAYGQIAQIVNANNFCVFLPPTDSTDRLISDTEWNAQAFCHGSAPKAKNAGKLPSGFIQSAHYVATDAYIQITGQIDPVKAKLDPKDDGGQYDVRAPNGASCAGWKYFVNLIEPSSNTYCIRCCNDTVNCNRGISEKGCAHIIPGDYSGPFNGNSAPAPAPAPATTSAKPAASSKATTSKASETTKAADKANDKASTKATDKTTTKADDNNTSTDKKTDATKDSKKETTNATDKTTSSSDKSNTTIANSKDAKDITPKDSAATAAASSSASASPSPAATNPNGPTENLVNNTNTTLANNGATTENTSKSAQENESVTEQSISAAGSFKPTTMITFTAAVMTLASMMIN